MGRCGQRKAILRPQFSAQDKDLNDVLWLRLAGFPSAKIHGKPFTAQRIVMGRKLGRTLTSKERIKIKNGNKMDCKRSNLEVA